MSNDVTEPLELAEARARLREADALWEHWRTHDITENDDEWASFSNAVQDHLEGRPVQARFLSSVREQGEAQPEAKEPINLTEQTLSGLLAVESRARKEAEDTVEAIRADLAEERRHRDRTEFLLGAIREEVGLWTSYAEESDDSRKSMHRIASLLETRAVATPPDLLHPTGRCRCGGEGRCDWCQAHPDPYQADEPPPNAEELLGVMQDTQAYIESCFAAGPKLEAVRKVVDAYNHPGNEKFGSLTAMQKITELLAAADTPDAADDPLTLREALDGTKSALRAEMIRCQAAEAKLEGVRAFADECRTCTGYGDPEVIRIFRAVADRLDVLLGTPDPGGKAAELAGWGEQKS